MKKSLPEKLPPIITCVLQKLNMADDAPLVLTNDDIPLRSVPVIEILAGQGLLSACIASHVACINCEAQAGIIRTGSKGKRFFASCNVCGSHFRISEQDAQEFRATWIGLACWLAKVMAFSEEPEPITENVFFLGHYEHGTVRYEIHLIKERGEATKSDYDVIAQQKTKSAIVLSLSKKPHPCSIQEISVMPITDWLIFKGGCFAVHFPSRIFAGADPVKQQAGYARVKNDLLQQQKEKLRDFVQKNLSSYRGVMHSDICTSIENAHADILLYHDKKGNQTRLSRQMALDAIKDVLRKNGLRDQISGIAQSY